MSNGGRFVRGRQSDEYLKLSCDRKVSPRGLYQASRKRWVPTMPNSFGLPAELSCPGKTAFCTDCYAVNSEQNAGVQELVDHNLRLLKQAATVNGMLTLLSEMVDRYAREAYRLQLPPAERMFRIHWDGDFFSEDYALAWAQVIRANPDIQFWAYTRSFVPPVNVVPSLAGIPNLALYLSADAWNIEAARQVAEKYQMRLALCGEDYQTTRQLGGDRPVVCPENSGRMALMTAGRGACVDCRLCPEGRRDIIFATSQQEDATAATWTAVSLVIAATQCANPACKVLLKRNNKGRQRKYCSDNCRWAVYNDRRARPPRQLARQAGSKGTSTSRYTEAELRDHLRQVAVRYRKLPAAYDLTNYRRENGGPSEGPYITVFGSLPSAREVAGIPELLAELDGPLKAAAS